MFFVGQEKILKEVAVLEKEILQGRPQAILLSAPSGWGKTYLALKIIRDTCGVDKANISYSSDWLIDPKKPINFVDEVQEVENQVEFYPILDWGGTTCIFATNELDGVKEPLMRRCIPLIFEPYTLNEMMQMVQHFLGIPNLHPEVCESIANKTKFSPGLTKVLCHRLSYIFRNYGAPKTGAELDQLADEFLGIDRNGLTSQDKRYLDILKRNGGRASITLLENTLRINKATIMRDIEPGLVFLKLIKITSRGRECL